MESGMRNTSILGHADSKYAGVRSGMMDLICMHRMYVYMYVWAFSPDYFNVSEENARKESKRQGQDAFLVPLLLP